MKRLLIVLVLNLLFSGNLQANEIRLICKFIDAYDTQENGSSIRITKDKSMYQYISEDNIVKINTKLKLLDGSVATTWNEEIIENKWKERIDGKGDRSHMYIDIFKKFTINRLTGEYRKEIYTKVKGEKRTGPTLIIYNCSIAKKKF